MSSIKFLSENLVDNAVISLTDGTANAQFPLSNIKNASPAIKFRSLTSSVKIQFDMITTNTVSAVGLLGDSTGTLGFINANLRYSTTTDFSGSPVISITLSSEFNKGLEFFDEIDARYWELELIGSSEVELGGIFLGKPLNLQYQNYSISSFTYFNNDNSDIRNNEYGQSFIDKRNLQQKLRGRIEYADKTEMELLDDMFKYHGRTRPMWVIVDSDSGSVSDGLFRFSSYGYIEQMPQWQASGGQHYSCAISIKEAI